MASASRGKAGSSVPKALTDQFCAITGESADVAERLLDACNGNLEMAIGMHMDSGGSQGPGLSTDGASSSALSASPAVDDAVRAPIPQRQEVLVDDSYTFGNFSIRGRRRGGRSVFDGLRDFQAEAREQELERAASGGATSRPISRKQRTLEDLFRPPIDIMFKGSFHSARDEGSAGNKWLMVNVQNSREFQCQVLNRDVWSNPAVKSIIKSHFIFWQVYNDSEEGRKYMQFYRITDWPYIAILDPRTGENMVAWNMVDALSLCDLVTNFLAEHQQPDGSISSPEGPPAKKQRNDSIVDATEASQLEAAIKASMVENVVPKKSKSKTIVIDSDDEFCSDDDLETFSDSEDDTTQGPSSQSKKNVISSAGNKKDSSKCAATTSQTQENSSSGSGNPTGTVQGLPGRPSVITSTPPTPTPSTSTCAPSSSSNNSSSSSSCKGTKNGTSCNQAPSSTSSQQVVSKFPAVQSTTESYHISYKDHLGKEEDPKSVLNFWFPNGQRKQLSIPCTSKLEAVALYVQEEGFHKEMYELVTNYPRRKLSDLDMSDTLKNHRLFPQETIFVQER